MRKFAVLLLLLALLLSSMQAVFAQTTRPRRVGQNAPPPPSTTTQKTSEPAQSNTDRRPPVLSGANNTGSATQTDPNAKQTPAKDEPIELGEGDILRVNTTLVTVPVSVLDRDGKYVPNLRKENFRIYEEGEEQEVAYFASVEKPFTVALVIDTSGSTLNRLEEIHDAAIAFVNQLRPDDTVMVVSFNDRVRLLCEPTTDRYAIQSAIRMAEPGDGTKLYDAVDFVINQRFNRIKGRKAIVLFTDGVDTTSRRATYESTTQDAEELDALIYPILYDTYQDTVGRLGGGGMGGRRRGGVSIADILGGILSGGNVGIGSGGGGGGGGGANCRGCTREEYERGAAYLRELAQRTGTRVEEAGDGRNLSQAFSIIAEELRRQYSIGYYPKSSAQAGQRRRINVRVNQPNMAVRARESYIISGQTSSDSYQQQQQPELKNRQSSSTQP
ncbi:MAG TPA: VWA domain-containing protein [Pyrinomonadaceae bacterium]|jgi:VWFA-related protein